MRTKRSIIFRCLSVVVMILMIGARLTCTKEQQYFDTKSGWLSSRALRVSLDKDVSPFSGLLRST